MRFIYTYRTSDGQRHTAEIEAESRDAAFARLRGELGIKPIKVTPADGPVSSGTRAGRDAVKVKSVRLAVGVLAAAILVGAWLLARQAGKPGGELHSRNGVDKSGAVFPERYGPSTYPAFTNLIARTHALETRQRARTADLNLDLLHNYALIRRLEDLSELYEEIDKGRQVVDEVRREAREIFGGIYEMFPPECVNERVDAEKLYDGLMTEVDAVEQRLDDEEEALVLLDDNRDKWDVRSGHLVFTDTRLEREFKFYNRPTEASSVRWRRDFGHGGIESAPVAAPQH